jgi:hypothetical protein
VPPAIAYAAAVSNVARADAALQEDLRARSGSGGPAHPPIAGELVLAISIVAAIAAASCAALLFAFGHTEDTEQAGYLATAGAVAAGVAFARLLARRAGDLLNALATVNAGALAAIVACTWALVHAGASSAVAALAMLAATAALLALDARWLRRPGGLAVLAPLRRPWMAPAGIVALVACLLPFAPASVHDPAKLAPAAIVGLALVAGLATGRRAMPGPPLAVDLAFCALLLVLVNDLQYHPDSAPANDVLHHLNFYVGPVNDALHGRALLVDTFSQYGIGVIYAIAAAYQLTGSQLSYGSFELGIGVLTALWFCAIYLLLRLSTRSQAIAIGAVVLAVLTNVFGSYSFTSYPMAGVLRFGPPFLVLLALVIGQRRGLPQWPALVLAALISVWSIETFAYTLGAVLAFVACSAWLAGGDARERLAPFGASVARLAAATLAVQCAFALATRLAAGAWPDWGTYLDFLRIYGAGDFGKLLIAPFSSGLGHAGVLFASAAAVIVLTLRGRELQPLTRAQLPVVAALTGFGIVAYTYYLGRSAEGVQAKIGVPTIVLAAVWADMAIRGARSSSRVPRLTFAAIACVAALLLAGSAASAFVDGWRRTALATLAGRSVILPPSDPRALLGQTFDESLRGRVDALIASPIASAYEPEQAAQQLVRRYGGRPALAVLLGPEMTTEVLVRSGRANALPIATPTEDALLPAAFSRLSAAAGRLPPRTVLVTEGSALAGDPGAPAAELLEVIREGQANYLRLRLRLLARMRARFRMHRLAADPSGIVAVELMPRRR